MRCIPRFKAQKKLSTLEAPQAIKALKDFSTWLKDDLAKQPNDRSWRLGKELYDKKFRLVMEADITPEQLLLSDAEARRQISARRYAQIG